MNEWYFYQEHGKTVGPFNEDDIRGRIKDGRLGVFDLLYKDGEPTWRMALEHTGLRSDFKASALSKLKERPWVCLRRKSPQRPEFLTSGPFTQAEVMQNILNGSLSYSDYAWKDGFSEWRRIGALEEFNPRLKATGTPNSLISPSLTSSPSLTNPSAVALGSTADILKNVTEFKRPRPALEEPPPTEATLGYGERKVDFSAAPPGVSANSIRIREPRQSRKKVPWLDWGLVAGLVLVLVGTVFFLSRWALPRRALAPPMSVFTTTTPKPVPLAAAESPSPPLPHQALGTKHDQDRDQDRDQDIPVDSDESPAELPEKPTGKSAAMAKAPRELHLSVAVRATPHLEVRSDGTREYPVYLQIIGLAGQVSEGGAFYRYVRLLPNGNVNQTLDLPAIKLPFGKFLVRAETQTLKKEVRFAWGLNEPVYKQTIVHSRKAWAYAIWKERLALLRLSEALEKQLTQALVPSKKFTGKGWEPLLALKRSNGNNYLMFVDWWELHSIVKDAKTGMNSELIGRVQKERDRLASFSVWK